MIERFTVNGTEYETVKLPQDPFRKAPCYECEFGLISGFKEPCRTCINAIGSEKDGRNYKLRKAMK